MTAQEPPIEPLLELRSVMARLRAECPWKREQTHRSLLRYLLEEAYETVEAVESGHPEPDADHLREELGDLLLQVYFHAAVAAERDDDALAGFEQLSEALIGVGVVGDRARWHLEHEIVSGAPCHALAGAVHPALRRVDPTVGEVEQGRELRVGLEQNVTALPPVSPRGPAARDSFLPTHRLRPGASRSRDHVDDRTVDEHRSAFLAGRGSNRLPSL